MFFLCLHVDSGLSKDGIKIEILIFGIYFIIISNTSPLMKNLALTL